MTKKRVKELLDKSDSVVSINEINELIKDIQMEKRAYQTHIFSNKSINFMKPDKYTLNQIVFGCLKETPFRKYKRFESNKFISKDKELLILSARVQLNCKSLADSSNINQMMCAIGDKMVLNAVQTCNEVSLSIHETNGEHLLTKKYSGFQLLDMCASYQYVFILGKTTESGESMIQKFDRKLKFVFMIYLDDEACGISCNENDLFVVYNQIDDEIPLKKLSINRIDYRTWIE